DAAPRRAADAATRTASDVSASPGGRPELLVGAGREKRALERIEAAPGAVLVIAADIETAARWAQRLARLGHAVRLDSGVPDAERVAAWDALSDGSARLAAGTRSALLAPLVAPATLVLIDEHEAAHKPPGPPRIHSRDVALERAARERLTLLLTSATPSVEAWRRAESGLVDMATPPRGPWPVVSVADTRGILRRAPHPPPPARARIARWDPDAARGARAEAQRAAAAAADVVIGTRGALRLFGPAALGLAAFVSPDQLLRAPDFRAGERALAFAWAAAERVAGDGV